MASARAHTSLSGPPDSHPQSPWACPLALACPTDLSYSACSPPPNLLLLSPPRCWGAILPFSFTSRERNHLSLSSLPSKSPSDSSLHPLNHVPGPGHQPSPLGPQARSPGRSGWVAPWGSRQWWAAFACPAGGPRGPWGLCCLICLPASGLAASSSLHANHLCLGPCGLGRHRQAHETPWSWGGG